MNTSIIGQRTENIARTHQIYNGLMGVRIALRLSDYGQTDVISFIGIPIEDPHASLIHKHEWQHIFFKSDLLARHVFAQQLRDELQTMTLGSGAHVWEGVDDFIEMFSNALDDLRCNALWGTIYPYSAAQIADRWRFQLRDSKKWHRNIYLYMMALGLGVTDEEMRSTGKIPVWTQEQNLLLAAVQTVLQEQTFVSTLRATRMVILQVFDKLLKTDELPQEKKGDVEYTTQSYATMTQAERSAALLQSFAKLGLKDGAQSYDTNIIEQDDVSDRITNETMWKVQAALGSEKTPQDEIEKAELQTILKSLLPGKPKDYEETLLARTGLTRFVDIEEVPEPPLEPLDRDLIASLRSKWSRLATNHRRRHTDSGDLNPSAYVDYILTGHDDGLFEDKVLGAGFSALIVLDMSGSVKDSWPKLARAGRILAKSMNLPFVNFEVWGFTGKKECTDILRFKNPHGGYSWPGMDEYAWGFTPLHTVSEIALRHSHNKHRDVQCVFFVTDAEPMVPGIDPKLLVAETRKNIERARKRGTRVFGLVSNGDQALAQRLFGDQKNWVATDLAGDEFIITMVDFVSKSLTTFLRDRR